MKKFLLLALLAVLIPFSVSAIDLGSGLVKDTATEAGYSATTGETTFAETIGVVIKTALSFVGVIFLVLMVYAGYLWMTARGEEEQITKAQKIIRSSIIGLVITVGAYSITTFVVPKILERTTGPGDTTGAPLVGCCEWSEVGGVCTSDHKEVVGNEADCLNLCDENTKYCCEFLGMVSPDQCK